MARVKKGINAHKRHKKVLKQAKGYYGAKQAVQGSKPCGNESVKKRICRQKAEKETVQTALDSKNKCRRKNERLIIQQTYART